MTEESRRAVRARYALAVVTVAATFLLILMGGLVTDNEAGDSVPDWPLAYGSAIPLAHLHGAVVYEYFHRVAASVVGVLTVALSSWAIVRQRRATRALGVAAVCWLLLQAGLGGIRVRLGESHSYGVAMLHAFSAQVFLAIITALAVHVSPDWRAPRERLEGVDILRIVAFTSTLALGSLAQALLGAGFRHRVLPVLPHAIVGAIVALFAVVSLASVRTIRFLRAPARLAVWIVGAQIALGIASYVLLESPGAEGRPVPLAVMVAVAHLGLGSAMIADSIVLSLRAFHLHWPWTS